MRRVLGSVAVAVVTAVAVLLPAPQAVAASKLVSTDPPSKAAVSTWPKRVTLTFSDAVDARSALVRVDGPGGAVVSVGDPDVVGTKVTQVLKSGVPMGSYLVRWTVLTADGTQLAGTVPFTYTSKASASASAERTAKDAARTSKDGSSGTTSDRTTRTSSERESSPAVGAVLLAAIGIGIVLLLKRLRAAFGR